MKFENIKKGDEVYISVTVRVNWSEGESFWVPKSVGRVTPKQFLVDNVRYKKEDGECVGRDHFLAAAMLGDTFPHYGEVVDQTKERDLLVRNINTAYEIGRVIGEIRIDHKSPNLMEILEKIKEIEVLTAGAQQSPTS